MLASLILSSLIVSAHAEPIVDTAAPDVDAPEFDGCWGAAGFAVPDQGEVGVPTDVAPRFHLNGTCASGVAVSLTDDQGIEVPFALSALEHRSETTFIVRPDSRLAASTGYELDIQPENGDPATLTFTTGDGASAEPATLTVVGATSAGWCEGRETVYSLEAFVQSNDTGVLGYLASDPDDSATYQPLLSTDGAATAWLTVDASIDDLQICAHVAALQMDGSLGAWTEVCDDVPVTERCGRGRTLAGGCRQNDAVPVSAGIFLPLVLLGLRRRKTQTL